MSTNLEKRINAIENVVLRVPPNISIYAVDHLIAFPDEEMKVDALLRLSQKLPEGNVRDKIDSYLDDYFVFLDDVEGSYPGLKVGLSGGTIFALKYLKVKKEGNLRGLKELLDSAHSSSTLYAEALIDYGLQEGDDAYFRRGMKMLNPEDVYKTLIGRSPRDKLLQLDLAELLLQSENKETVLDGVRRLSQSDDVEIDKKISIALQNYQKLNVYPEAKDLLERLIPVAYEMSSDKDKFVRDFFNVDTQRAVCLAERLAEEKTTFSEIYEIAELVMKHSQEDPITIFDRAIIVENSYENVVKVAQRVSNKNVAVRYFKQALQKRAKLSEYRKTGDVLLSRRLDDLAGQFYEKSLGKKKSLKKYKDLGKHCLDLGSDKLARKFIGEVAERADTFGQYFTAYETLLKKSSQSETERIFLEGLERFSTIDAYEFVFSYLEGHYSLQVAGEFAFGIKGVSNEISKLCRSYISRLEEASKKEEERKPLRREPVSQSFDEEAHRDSPETLRPNIDKTEPPRKTKKRFIGIPNFAVGDMVYVELDEDKLAKLDEDELAKVLDEDELAKLLGR